MAPSKSKKEEGDHPYKIVLFPDDKQDKLSIDVSPTSWINYSESLQSYACPFPTGPFGAADIDRLHKKIKHCDSPDKSWSLHRVIIHGRARTYLEACKAVEALEYERYAFSTDCESSVDRAMHEENEIARSTKNKKTLDEELSEVICNLSTKSKGTPTRRKKGELSKKQRSKSSSESSSSGRSTPTQPKKKDKKTVLSSSDLSSPEDLRPKNLEKTETAGANSYFQKSPAAASPGSGMSLTKGQSAEAVIEVSSPGSSSPDMSRKEKQYRKDFSKSHTSFTSPSTSFAPEKDSTRSLLRDKRPNSVQKRREVNDSYTKSESQSNPTTPSTPRTGKRNHREMQDSSSGDENVIKKRKGGRHSRSKERRRSPRDYSVYQPSTPASPQRTTPKSHRRLSEGPILNRSLSVESYRTDWKVTKPRRTQSSDDNRAHPIDQHSDHSSGRHSLPTVEEGQSLKSIRDDIKRMFSSLANRVDRLHGAQVESDGKLDLLVRIFDKNPPAQRDSDDDNDVNDPNPIILPTETVEQFALFEAKLKADQDYRRRIKKRIRNMVPKPTQKYGTHDLSVIVRVYLSKKLVTENFVALKTMGTKVALKNTDFYQCLLAAHQEIRPDEMNDKTFRGFLKNMFNAAGDWDGGRALRRPDRPL